jgi:gliding motility-associated-like protein
VCDAAAVVLEVQAGPGVVFAWDDQSADASRVVTESGQYVVLASDAHCPGSDTIGVTFVDTHPGFFAPDSICLGEAFDLFPENQHFQARHAWSFDPPALAPTPQVDPEGLNLAEPGVYRIQHAVEIMGCLGQTYRDLTVLPLPEIGLPADTFLCRDSLLAIRPVIPDGATFSWEDGHPELDRQLDRPGTFQLAVVEGRCAGAARLVVRPGDCLTPVVFAPNIFSPNGDGLHDLFEVWVRNAASVESLAIYDRWGSLLHQSSSDISWDGRAGGRAVEPGAYVYVLKIKRKDGLYATAGGGVTVLR